MNDQDPSQTEESIAMLNGETLVQDIPPTVEDYENGEDLEQYGDNPDQLPEGG